jgi:hypothetical protein
MRKIFRSSFFWQFAGGFAIGAVGVVTLHPAEATTVADHAPAPVLATR